MRGLFITYTSGIMFVLNKTCLNIPLQHLYEIYTTRISVIMYLHIPVVCLFYKTITIAKMRISSIEEHVYSGIAYTESDKFNCETKATVPIKNVLGMPPQTRLLKYLSHCILTFQCDT